MISLGRTHGDILTEVREQQDIKEHALLHIFHYLDSNTEMSQQFSGGVTVISVAMLVSHVNDSKVEIDDIQTPQALC